MQLVAPRETLTRDVPAHTLSDYLYEVGRGAMTGVGRGVYDRYLAYLEDPDVSDQELAARLAEIRAERLREHPLGGTTGGKLLQAGGEMMPLMLAGEVLPAAMLMKKGVGLGSIAKGLIPGTKVAMPSLRLPGMTRILSAGITGTIIGGAERKLQEPDASVSDVAKNALTQGMWWGAGEGLAVAVGAMVKKFGSQRGVMASLDDDLTRRAKEVLVPLTRGEVPPLTGNSRAVLRDLGIDAGMINELGDNVWFMAKHKVETGRLALPQTRKLRAQKVPAPEGYKSKHITSDIDDVWILGVNRQGQNIYNGRAVVTPGQKGVVSTHMYGVGDNLHNIKWVDTDLSGTIQKAGVLTPEQATRRLFSVATDIPIEQEVSSSAVLQKALTQRMDELNAFNKRSKAVAHKMKDIKYGKLLRKGERYEATMVKHKLKAGGVDWFSPAERTTITDSAENILKLAERHEIHFENVKAVGVDMPMVELPIPVTPLAKHVPQEVVDVSGKIMLDGAEVRGSSMPVLDNSLNWMQMTSRKMFDSIKVPIWMHSPNVKKAVGVYGDWHMYRNTLMTNFAKKHRAQITRLTNTISSDDVLMGKRLVFLANLNEKKIADVAEASWLAKAQVSDDAMRYYKAESDSVAELLRMKGQVLLNKLGYEKMSPKSAEAIALKAKVDGDVLKAIETGYFPTSQTGKYIVGRKVHGVTVNDYSKDSNDIITVCQTRGEARKVASQIAKQVGSDNVFIDTNVMQYQKEYFKRYPSPDMFEAMLEQGGWNADEIQPLLNAWNAKGGRFSIIGRRVGLGFNVDDLDLHIERWSDRLFAANARSKFSPLIDDIVDGARGAPDGGYVEAMARKLELVGGDTLAKARTAIYGWHLGGKVAFFMQNMTQSFLDTLPECVRHEGWVKGAKTWMDSWKYMRYFYANPEKKLKIIDGISDPYIKSVLTKLDAAQMLGPGFTKEFMHGQRLYGAKRLATELEKWVGAVGTKSEQMNRGHAAVAGALIAKHGKHSKKVGEKLAVSFINRTQFPFQAYNVPQMFVGQGDLKNAMRFTYMYKGFMANQIGRMMDIWATGETRYIAAQAMSAIALYGMAGVPGYNLAKAAFMKGTGEDFETKLRNYMDKPDPKVATDSFLEYVFSKGGWKAGAEKTMWSGLPSLAGVSTDTWLGMADIPYTHLDGYLGVLNIVKDPILAYDKVTKGRGLEAVAGLMPTAIKNIMLSYEWSKKGLVDRTGQVVYNPTEADIMRKMIGIPSLGVSQMYKVRHLVKTEVAIHKANVADFNYKIKEAYKSKDMKALQVVVNEVREYNREHPARPIKLDFNRLYREALERLEPTHIEGVPDWALARLTEYERAYR